MQLPKYKKYKESGVKWIGQIPQNWKIEKLRAVTELKSEKNRPTLQVLSVYREFGVIQKDSRDDNHNVTSQDTSTYKAVKPGDLVVNKMKAWQGSMGVSEHEGIVSPAYITCKLKTEKVFPKYLHYLLRSHPYIGVYNALSYGVRVGQWDMHYEDFKKIPICLPDKKEMSSIVNFIDKKFAEIDNAISKKEKLIELLKEQKSILINQTVTRGVDPKVKLKNSGIDWIGKIPAHWEIKKLKYVVKGKLKYGANEEAQDQNKSDPRYIRITDFGDNGELKDETFKSLPFRKAKEFILKEGDLLFARSGATVGKTFLFTGYKGTACFAGYLIKATPQNEVLLPEFLYYFTKSSVYNRWKEIIFSKATIQNIGADKYSDLFIIIPPLREQTSLLSKLRKELLKIDLSINKINHSIDLYLQYKNILISNAVTGKIKVT